MKRTDLLDELARMLVHLDDEMLKTVYEFVLTISVPANGGHGQ
ncbi:hypothetical protein [Intestinimonas sp.]|nr:hypothetical protein [Intestinimonas sp.]